MQKPSSQPFTDNHILCAIILMLRDGHLQLFDRDDGQRLPPTLFHSPNAKEYLARDDAFIGITGPHSDRRIGLMLATRMPVYDDRVLEEYLMRVIVDDRWMKYYGFGSCCSGASSGPIINCCLLLLLTMVAFGLACEMMGPVT